MQKILVLCYNYEPSQFPKKPDSSGRFFTYGFGGLFGKLLKKYTKEYKIEVWRVDSYCDEHFYEKDIDGLKYRVFKSIRIPNLGHFSWNFIRELKKEYRKNKPILFVVHTHNWQTYQIAFFLKKAMIITTHHGDWSPFYLIKHTSGFRKLRAFIGIMAEKIVLKNINHFLIGDLKQIEYVKKAVKNFRYTLYSTGIDFNIFKPISKSEARSLLGWGQDKNYILYVGKLYKYKQIEDLLKIWIEIRKQKPGTELILVGNEARGVWGEEYYDLAEESGATIIGRVPNHDLYKYYCASDVYVLLSLRDDYFGGTGIAPIESLACNTPVVSNSMRNYLGDDVKEICEMPDTLEGYKEAIIDILDHKDKFMNMRERLEKYYSYEHVIKRFDEIFKEVLDLQKNK